MIKKIVKRIAGSLGYKIIKRDTNLPNMGYDRYEYLNSDGTFDYEIYKRTQVLGNISKLDWVWVLEENISFLSDYLKIRNCDLNFGICHGTRRGKEQEWFRKYLACDVIGTEISETALQFPNTICWDFHNVKPEWLGNVDFIYSNSFDHSYDPKVCLNAWMSCLKKGGVCVLEHSSDHISADELDPFGADISIMPYLILNWSQGNFYVSNILKAPVKDENLNYLKYLIIEKKS